MRYEYSTNVDNLNAAREAVEDLGLEVVVPDEYTLTVDIDIPYEAADEVLECK